MRPIEESRTIAKTEGFTSGDIARACDPPMKAVTVWRILAGRRGGHSRSTEAISKALDRLLEAKAGTAT